MGRGHAYDVSLQGAVAGIPHLSLSEPAGPFDIAPGAEQLVRIRLILSAPVEKIAANVNWICQTPFGREAVFADEIVVSQQVTEPNWEALIADPPYSLNPIRRPERLYGRDTVLRTLELVAMSASSKFVWGQKRIGKTSLLQVSAANLTHCSDTTCILLRMGEFARMLA